MTFEKGFIHIAVVSVFIMFSSCHETREKSDDGENDKVTVTSEPSKTTEVTVEELKISEFDHELVSNGKVSGRDHADLYFPSGDNLVATVNVRNGSRVRKGDRLATLDTYKLKREKESAETALAKSELELKDALIGQGYDPDAPESIPDDVMRLARLRSGYLEAEASLAKVMHSIDETVLTAPFEGVVANLSGKAFNRPDPSKPFCTVIGSGMDVEFSILESELAVISTGDKVAVTPFATSGTYTGKVTEINPVVDENGLVKLVASIDSGKGLYDGMNVKVSVKKSLGSQLVIPKSALVLRTGRQVVFTLDEKGEKAMWNYVATGLENKDHYTVTEGLESGMKVIVSGNVNLAHESPVKVVR